MAPVNLALLIGFGLVNGGALFYFYQQSRRLKHIQKILSLKSHHHAEFLGNIPFAWCCWCEGDVLVKSSAEFRRMMHFSEKESVSVDDFLRIVGNSLFSPFQRALMHICDFGGDFSLQVALFDGTLHVEIKGCLLTWPAMYSGESQRQMILLFFTDLTRVVQAKNWHETLYREKLAELTKQRILMDNLPLAVWQRDTNGRIVYCNNSYASILDSTPSRVIAETQELLHENSAAGGYDLAKKAFHTGEKQSRQTSVVINGHRCLMEISEVPVKGQSYTVGYARDVTEQEEARTNLSRHIKAHREVLYQISTPIAIYGPDTRLDFFNHAHLKLFQLDEAWLYTKPTLGEVLEVLREKRRIPEYPDFPAHKRKRLRLFHDLLEPVHEILHQSDGRILRLMIAPYPLGGLLYLFDDITDKLALEREHNTLIAVQKETLDHLYEGIIVFGSDNRIRLSNPALENIWDLPKELCVPGKHVNEILKRVSCLFKNSQEGTNLKKQMVEMLSKRRSLNGQFHLINNRTVSYSYVPLPDGSHLMSFVSTSTQ